MMWRRIAMYSTTSSRTAALDLSSTSSSCAWSACYCCFLRFRFAASSTLSRCSPLSLAHYYSRFVCCYSHRRSLLLMSRLDSTGLSVPCLLFPPSYSMFDHRLLEILILDYLRAICRLSWCSRPARSFYFHLLVDDYVDDVVV